MKPIVIFIVLFFNFNLLSAPGGVDRKAQRAEELYAGGSYHGALRVFLELFEMDSSNSMVSYKIGDCYLKTGLSSRKAEYFLRRSLNNCSGFCKDLNRKENAAPMEAHLLLGEALHLNYKFPEAITEFEFYQQALKTARVHDQKLLKDLKKKIEVSKFAIEMMSQPADVKIVNLGSAINSPYADYAPRLTADQKTMIFTTRRPENTGGKTFDEGQFFEDIFLSQKSVTGWSTAKNMGLPLNTVANEAAVAISADGQEILIYKDDMGDGNIYSSKLHGLKWSVPHKLNTNINSPFWEPCAFISADGNLLYFVSDRPGGYGGTDIYFSKKTSSGDWGKAVNLGPTINTPDDEYSPFIHPDGRTLYFSSKGHKGMGGYDVFFSSPMSTDSKVWLAPTNVGFPVNGPGDDAFYMVSPDKQTAFYSSMREDGFGEKDNYMVTFSNPEASPLSLVSGVMLTTSSNTMKGMKITITDNGTGELVGVYHPNAATGKYSYILTPGKSYNIAYESEGALFYSENRYVGQTTQFTEVDQPVTMPALHVGSSVRLNNIFFDFDSHDLGPASKTELERIFTLLSVHPEVHVEVAGYADSQGSDEYNRNLSRKRAQAVVNYLSKRGIDPARMIASGYGYVKDKNVLPLNDAQHKKMLNAGRDTERRVELKITDVKKNKN